MKTTNEAQRIKQIINNYKHLSKEEQTYISGIVEGLNLKNTKLLTQMLMISK